LGGKAKGLGCKAKAKDFGINLGQGLSSLGGAVIGKLK